MASLAHRLDRIAAALGGEGEPGVLVIFVADDGIPRMDAGEEVDLESIDLARRVFVYRQVAAGSRPTIPHTAPPWA